MKGNEGQIERHIDVLDGVRAFGVGFVVWFHFWQQSWITPNLGFPSGLGRYLGIQGFNLELFVRYGFQFVDLLILLSAFCNFYPYARSILLQEHWPDTKQFYLKRAVRILPSYYLCLAVTLLVMVVEGTAAEAFSWKDLLMHLFCMGPLFPETYAGTGFNGVLWTVQIEVFYYLLMPWIAKAFRRWPVTVCTGLWACGLIAANYIVCEKADKIGMLVNHFATFAGCYANGMLLCMLYLTFKGFHGENQYTRLTATGVVFAVIFFLGKQMQQLGAGERQIVQLQGRFELSLLFSCLILALPFASGWMKFLFSNKAAKGLAAISYNLYIWHQYIAVKCKTWRIPYWEGDTPPNMLWDRAWMQNYQMLVLVLALATAILLTYGFERPMAAFLMKCRDRTDRGNDESIGKSA